MTMTRMEDCVFKGEERSDEGVTHGESAHSRRKGLEVNYARKDMEWAHKWLVERVFDVET